MQLLNHCLIKKRDSKRDLIWPISPSNFEIDFIFLTEIKVI